MRKKIEKSVTLCCAALTVTAYAVQEAGSDTAADAWAKVTANP